MASLTEKSIDTVEQSQWSDAPHSVELKSLDSPAFIIETDEDDLPLQPLRWSTQQMFYTFWPFICGVGKEGAREG